MHPKDFIRGNAPKVLILIPRQKKLAESDRLSDMLCQIVGPCCEGGQPPYGSSVAMTDESIAPSNLKRAKQSAPAAYGLYRRFRSEERRVGKECRSRWS